MKVMVDVLLELEGEERFRFVRDNDGGTRKTFEADLVVWRVGGEVATVWAQQVYGSGRRAKNGTAFSRRPDDLPGDVRDTLADLGRQMPSW